jgi:MoxR-like ATPase
MSTMKTQTQNEMKTQNEERWKLAIALMQVMPRTYLWGPPGIGKTRAAYDAARATGKAVYSCTLTDDDCVQEVIGCPIPQGDRFIWQDGPITRAMREGALLVLNEVSRASSAIKDKLLAVLDDPEIAEITLPHGERVRPTRGFAVVGTANTDTSSLDPALADRFDAVVELRGPHPKLVEHLEMHQRGLGRTVLDSYADIARAVSPRSALAYVRLVCSAGWEPMAAASAIWSDRAQDVLTAIRVHALGGV